MTQRSPVDERLAPTIREVLAEMIDELPTSPMAMPPEGEAVGLIPRSAARSTARVLTAATAGVVLIAGLVFAASRRSDHSVAEPSVPAAADVDQRAVDGVRMIVFVLAGASDESLELIRDNLEMLPNIDPDRIRYLGPEESLDQARRLLADDPVTFELLNVENIPTAFYVTPIEGTTYDELAEVAAFVETLPQVARVDIDPEGRPSIPGVPESDETARSAGPTNATAPVTTTAATLRSTGLTGSSRASITWYAPNGTGKSTAAGDELACTAPRDDGGCDAVVGRRTVRHRTPNGQIDVITEYGPAESTWWQELVRSGEEVDLGGRRGLVIPGNDELAGLIVSPDTRVVLVGEAGTDPAGLASALTTHDETLDVPVVFGQAVASEEEFPRDSVVDGIAARYYAGYLDTTVHQPCVGGIGVPWNGTSCVAVEPDTLVITVASPSPTGTILIATLPLRTATATVVADGHPSRDLAITDASDVGYKLVFADLDGIVPSELRAFDQDGAEIGRTPVVSDGAVSLGYLPVRAGS